MKGRVGGPPLDPLSSVQFVQDGGSPGNADIVGMSATLSWPLPGVVRTGGFGKSRDRDKRLTQQKPRPTAAEEMRGEGVWRAIRPLLVELNRAEDFSPGPFSGPANRAH
jgi:hypothetical protein